MNFQSTSAKSNDTHLRKRIGAYGEQLAADFLLRKGYEIIERNVYIKGGEVDIVARAQHDLVFVEVKTRTNQQYGYGEEAVDSRKISRMRHVARTYSIPADSKYIRFDIVAVQLDIASNRVTIRHIKNIVLD